MFNTEFTAGKISTANHDGQAYSTTGPDNVSNVSNAAASHVVSKCYLWATFLTFTPLQTEMLRNGAAILRDYIMIGYLLNC